MDRWEQSLLRRQLYVSLVHLMNADEDNAIASIETKASGKFVSRKGNASMQHNSARKVIPLNDEELLKSSSSSFTHFPNGGGLRDIRRSYVRERFATPEDLAKPELGREQLGVPAPPSIPFSVENSVQSGGSTPVACMGKHGRRWWGIAGRFRSSA